MLGDTPARDLKVTLQDIYTIDRCASSGKNGDGRARARSYLEHARARPDISVSFKPREDVILKFGDAMVRELVKRRINRRIAH